MASMQSWRSLVVNGKGRGWLAYWVGGGWAALPDGTGDWDMMVDVLGSLVFRFMYYFFLPGGLLVNAVQGSPLWTPWRATQGYI